jgi:membrane protein
LAEAVVKGLGAVEFGDRIIIFGASMLLSVLPLIIVLSTFANHQVDDDISQHLGLSGHAAQVMDGLFRSSKSSVNIGLAIGLLLSLAGTIAVARSVQVIYERAFGVPHGRGTGYLLRSVVWVVFVTAAVISDAAIGRTVRDGPAGPLVLGLVEFGGFALFFWWSVHYLLGGRERWGQTLPVAIATTLYWIGLGVFAEFYFSATIASDSKTYGAIGVTFTLVTWFIAMGAVLTLGAVVGAAWQKQHDLHRHTAERGMAATTAPDE